MLSVIKMVRCVQKEWVVGVVLWGMVSGAFGSTEPSLKINSVHMPPIEMEGDQVVTGKHYPVGVSFTANCGDYCTGPGVKLTVSDVPLPIDKNGCKKNPSSIMELPTTDKLGDNFRGFKVDSQNEVSMTAGFKWSGWVTNPGENTIELRSIKGKPEEFYVWVYYQVGYPDWFACYADQRVGITAESKEKVKISGLEEALLTSEGTFTMSNICVYSSNGEVKLSFNGGDLGDENEFFALRQSNNKMTIPYTITVTTHESLKAANTFKKDGRAGGYWKVNSEAEDCKNIPNMSFTIQADKQAMNAAGAGVYSDTMTVTVEPK